MKRLKKLFFLAGILVFSGCVISFEPIFEDKQIIQDPNIEGQYQNYDRRGVPLSGYWHIEKSGDFKNSYQITIFEEQACQILIGTLFKIGDLVFLDFVPWQENSMTRWIGARPSQTELMHGALFSRRHLIWRVEINKEGLRYFTSTWDGARHMREQAPELVRNQRPAGETGILILPDNKKAAQKYLVKFAGDKTCFDYEGRLKKISRNEARKIMGKKGYPDEEAESEEEQ